MGLSADFGATASILLSVLVTIASLLLSLAAGFLFNKQVLAAPICFCAILGLLATSYLLQFMTGIFHFFGLLSGDLTGPLVSILLTLSGMLVGAYMGFRFSYLFLFASYAFLSAYSFVRGISLFLGGFLPEVDLLFALYTVHDMPRITLAQVIYTLLIVIIWSVLTQKLIAKEWGTTSQAQKL